MVAIEVDAVTQAAAALGLLLGLGWLVRWRQAGARWGRVRWGLRVGLLAAAAAACWGPEVGGRQAARRRAVVLDVSRSLARAQARRGDWARAALADLAGDDEAALVLVGAETRVVAPLAPVDDLRQRLDAALSLPLDDRGSDLGAALRLAAGVGVDEVLLVSDGRETTGALLAAAAELGRAGVRLHTLAPDVARPAGVRLVHLEAPARAAPGERLAVVVEAQAASAGPVTVTLEVEDDLGAREVGRVRQAAPALAPWRVRFSVPPLPQPGLVTLRARVRGLGRDDDPGDDVAEHVVAIGDPPRVWRVGSVGPLDGIPTRALTPQALGAALSVGAPDLILIGDVAARDLAAAVGQLEAAVEAGTGLVVAGARLAFGPGGYAGTPLERLLPVTSGPAEEERAGLDLVVALDASGSMGAPVGDATRYQQAVSSAVPVQLLRDGDRLGVIRFAGRPERFAPLGPPAPDLLERLAGRAPGGETDVGAALSLGLEMLAASGERDASLIVATDSEDPDPSRHAAAIRSRAAAFPAGALDVVLVLIGRDGDTGSLEALAAQVGPAARVVQVADAEQALRELVASELASRRNERRSGRFAVAVGESGQAWGLTALAGLTAYAPTRPREAAEVLAVVRDAEANDPPACALGRRGAGRVLAAPVEVTWLPRLLGPALGRLLPPRRDALELSAARQGRGLAVELRGPLGGDVEVRLLAADGARLAAAPWPLTPTQARLTWDAVPAAAAQVVAVDGLGERLAGVAVPALGVAELAAVGPDPGALIDAARAGGGALLTGWPSLEQPLPRPRAAAEVRALAPWLWGLALLLLLADAGWGVVAARR